MTNPLFRRKSERDLLKIWVKFKEHSFRIKNPMTKFKSDKNLDAKYNLKIHRSFKS
jgi:hypothetical protein